MFHWHKPATWVRVLSSPFAIDEQAFEARYPSTGSSILNCSKWREDRVKKKWQAHHREDKIRNFP